MARERFYYAISWAISVVAISIPWATANGETFTGWFFIYPYSLLYPVGLLLGLVVLLAKTKPFLLSLLAGILMIFGVLGGVRGVEILDSIGRSLGVTVSPSAGLGFAFFWSIFYVFVASILGERMTGE